MDEIIILTTAFEKRKNSNLVMRNWVGCTVLRNRQV